MMSCTVDVAHAAITYVEGNFLSLSFTNTEVRSVLPLQSI